MRCRFSKETRVRIWKSPSPAQLTSGGRTSESARAAGAVFSQMTPIFADNKNKSASIANSTRKF
jgi:hypothetical protein